MNVQNATLCLASLGIFVLSGCEDKGTKVVFGRPTATGCELSLENLPDTAPQWVLLRINPDKTETPDPQARLKFYREGSAYKAKYTVASFSDVYTYNCTINSEREEMTCKEEPKIKDWCQSLLVAGKDCSIETLRGIDPDVTSAQAEEGVKNATALYEKYKEQANFKFNNNNLGNKLQGLAYFRIDKRNCRLTITDNYMTIYDGERIEDSNPVGTNPMIQYNPAESGELFWEHCTDSEDFVALKTAEFPNSEKEMYQNFCLPNRQCFFGLKEPVYYHYVGQDGRKPEDGCSYSFDIWSNWRPLKSDLPAPIVDFKGKKEVRYQYTATFDEPGAKVTEIVRYKTCNGKKEQVEVSCSLAGVQ